MSLTNSPRAKTDLAWSLTGVTDKHAGQSLIRTLCKYIPTYSSGARQIYSEGECHFISFDRVIFFANTHDYTKTFSRIPPEAVKKTSIHLFSHGNQKLIFLQKATGKPVKMFSFNQTLSLILRNIDRNEGFIPILQRSNVSDTSDKRPLIELSSLDMATLKNEFSSFEISMIMKQVKQGYINLYRLYSHQNKK